jgi:transcriptional regulator with XRE-family HTH domain
MLTGMSCPAPRRERLIRARKKLKKQQQDIADELGVSQATVSRWEHDGAIPRRGNWKRVAEAYGVPVSIFMPDDEGNGK